MVENNERGRQARQYFIEVEKRFRHAGNLVEAIRAALTPIIRENEQYRARLELARNFLPNGNPGDLNRAGLPKNKFRRSCYVARNGRDISLLRTLLHQLRTRLRLASLFRAFGSGSELSRGVLLARDADFRLRRSAPFVCMRSGIRHDGGARHRRRGGNEDDAGCRSAAGARLGGICGQAGSGAEADATCV